MLRIVDITGPDINNGLGVRCTVWVAGCKHHCEGCHNAWTWKFDQGRDYTEKSEEILSQIREWLDKEYVKGLTLSGGDPLTQTPAALEELLELIKIVKEEYPDKDIWLYTGFTLKELEETKISIYKDILNYVDYVVEGRFILAKRDLSIAFRGSTNQRIMKKKETQSDDIKFSENFEEVDF